MTTPTILIVDDEAPILELWSRILVDEGYAVARAADAFDALRVLAVSRPWVAICDVHLPGPSGVWLADMIRQQSPTTAIALASGDYFIPPRESLRPAVVACILKPITRDELLAAVRKGVAWSNDVQLLNLKLSRMPLHGRRAAAARRLNTRAGS